MAYIRRIRIENYRSIKHLDVDLTPPEGDPKPFRHLILTGPNGSGKTSALSLISGRIFRTAVSPTQVSSPDNLAACQLEFDETPAQVSARLFAGGLVLASFKAQRLWKLSDVKGPTKLDWDRNFLSSQGTASSLAPQYLVNRKAEQAFALTDGDRAAADAIGAWFTELQRQLSRIFEDPGLKLEFDRKSFSLSLRYSDGREVTLAQLADGHSAALAIFFELFVHSEARREKFGLPSDLVQGIVVIDEVETHLHLRLQELILPFLTELFPTFQFIVATHSPAVIASIPDAVVYDLASREAVASEDLQGIRYGTLVTGHFGVESDMDLDSTEKLRHLRSLARKPDRTPEEQQELDELADVLNARSKTLAVEVWKALHPAPPARAQGGAS